LTTYHPANPPPTGGPASPSDTGLPVAATAAALAGDLAGAFAIIGWAEDEITRAARRHPHHGDVLYHGFGLLTPRAIGPGMDTEFVYRAHAAELLDRLTTGADTRAATAAELCVLCCRASLRTPMHGAAAGLYLRLWRQAFPTHQPASGLDDTLASYARLHGAQIDDLEHALRRQAAAPGRRLQRVECGGWHHGRRVACRYATSTADDPMPEASPAAACGPAPSHPVPCGAPDAGASQRHRAPGSSTPWKET
jgi:hypothetical protein